MEEFNADMAQKFYTVLKQIGDHHIGVIDSFRSRFATKLEHKKYVDGLEDCIEVILKTKDKTKIIELARVAHQMKIFVESKFLPILIQEIAAEPSLNNAETELKKYEKNEIAYTAWDYKKMYEIHQSAPENTIIKEKLGKVLSEYADTIKKENYTDTLDKYICDLFEKFKLILYSQRSNIEQEIKILTFLETVNQTSNLTEIEGNVGVISSILIKLNALLIEEKNVFFDKFKKFINERTNYENMIKFSIQESKTKNKKISVNDIKEDLRKITSRPEEIVAYQAYVSKFMLKYPADFKQCYEDDVPLFLAKLTQTASFQIGRERLKGENTTLMGKLDALTKLPNRQVHDERLSSLVDGVKNNNFKFSYVMFDIDHFKKFNDDYGHPVGDKVLAFVAQITREFLENKIFISRWGGEEFVCLMPNIDKAKAAEIADGLRERIAEASELYLPDVEYQKDKETLKIGKGVKITISVGVASYPEDGVLNNPNSMSPSDIHTKADSALYKAKNSGRNRVITFQK